MNWSDTLAFRIADCGSRLCVGLDPRPERHTGAALGDWLRRVVDETAPHAACFKPNAAYFEALGSEGVRVLEHLCREWIPPEIPIIYDAKRGDIGETQKYYAKAAFEGLGAGSITLNPYLGFETLDPFLAYPDRGLYLLGVTSNPGAVDLELLPLAEGGRVFERVAGFAAQHAGQVGLVVGLTNAAAGVLESIPDVPLLVPGLGAQGGDLKALTAGGPRSAPIVINVSRGILYDEPNLSFTEKARRYADQIAAVLG
ncbi:MAG: orotidine-5'-phosphate decarboxylase [Verrucomicrobiales bacterium]